MAYISKRYAPYQPGQDEPFKVSRSKIELFMQCPRCFWLDTRLKIKRPSGPPFNINKTIDELYKKEFDRHRAAGTPHPIMADNQIKAVPYQHEDLDKWRYNFTGVTALYKPTNLHVFGAIDDVWVNDDGELIVVDYKATSKNKEVSIDSDWQISYKRQLEVYQWLLRQNGFKVSDTGYWVEPTLKQMKACMESDTMPPVGDHIMGGPCEFCTYARSRTELTLKALKTS